MIVLAVAPADQRNCLAGAIECGKRGLRVFPVHSVRGVVCTCQPWRDKNGMGPCEHPGKHLRFRNWQERATSDLEAIEEFWWNHKGTNVAIATGAGSGIFVLDIDARNGGDDSLDTLIHRSTSTAGCRIRWKPSPAAAAVTSISIQASWRAGPEHGGPAPRH